MKFMCYVWNVEYYCKSMNIYLQPKKDIPYKKDLPYNLIPYKVLNLITIHYRKGFIPVYADFW